MAPIFPPPLRPLITHQCTTARFLISRKKKLPHKSLTNKSHVASSHRLPNLLNHYSHSLHFPPSICSGVSLPHPSLRSVLGPRSPPLRSPLSSMTTPQAAADSSQSSSTKTVRVVIKGRVQGVFYRDWTMENADQLGLKGWVRNRRDGSVEALFSGNHDAVQEMEQRCRRGPPDAMVTGLEVFPSSDDPGTGFERKLTV